MRYSPSRSSASAPRWARPCRRTRGGGARGTCLGVRDVAAGPGQRVAERLAVDPRTRGGGDEAALPPQERARRERVREQAGGIVAYATDADLMLAVFSWSGRVWAVALAPPGAPPREVAVPRPPPDPPPPPPRTPRALLPPRPLRFSPPP